MDRGAGFDRSDVAKLDSTFREEGCTGGSGPCIGGASSPVDPRVVNEVLEDASHVIVFLEMKVARAR